tara:strand:+ start:7592 stop:8554 length:963 start_codon:yes stop_codon:yes gene_type:complete
MKSLTAILFFNFFLGLLFSHNKNENLNLTFYNFESKNFEAQKDESVSKNMMLSLAVPGLGQYIRGDKKRAALFLGVELTALYLNRLYNKRGNDKVSEYEKFSDLHWDFENWIINYDCWNPAYQGINNDCDYSFSNLFSNIETDINGNQIEDYLAIWEHSHHINFYYDNALVSTNDEIFQDIYFEFITWDPSMHNDQGFVEFYEIEILKDHHFYEGIRKYNMFFAGWDDATTNIEEVIQPSGYAVATSPNKNLYNDTWNNSIELYDYAEYAVTALYLNHVISMFDIYFKSKFDNRFNVNLENSYNSKLKCGNFLINLNLEL